MSAPASRRPLWCLAPLFASSCLGPQVSDTVSRPELILPAGSTVPSIYDTDDGRLIAAHQGVSGTVPLLSGFAGGKPVRFWDFGAAPDHVAPLYRLVTKNGATTTPLA